MSANQGRGFSFLRDVISALRAGDFDRAKAIYTWDRDKLETQGQNIRSEADKLLRLEPTGL